MGFSTQKGKKPLYIYFVKSSSRKELRTSSASLPPSFIVREDSPDCLAEEALSCSRHGKKGGRVSTQKKIFFYFDEGEALKLLLPSGDTWC